MSQGGDQIKRLQVSENYNKKSGESTYYRCIGFAFPKFIIRCKEFRGDYNNIPENLVLKREEVPEMKIDIQK